MDRVPRMGDVIEAFNCVGLLLSDPVMTNDGFEGNPAYFVHVLWLKHGNLKEYFHLASEHGKWNLLAEL